MHSSKNSAHQVHRVSAERHLDLNKLLREHFCTGKTRKKVAKRSMKNQRKKK